MGRTGVFRYRDPDDLTAAAEEVPGRGVVSGRGTYDQDGAMAGGGGEGSEGSGGTAGGDVMDLVRGVSTRKESKLLAGLGVRCGITGRDGCGGSVEAGTDGTLAVFGEDLLPLELA